MRNNNVLNLGHLAAIVLLGSLLIISGCGKSVSVGGGTESARTVNIATAAQRDIYGNTSYSGRLKASSEVEVQAKISARVVAINVKAGQAVRTGEILMSLDNSSLQASIKEAEAQVASTKAAQVNNEISLETARRTYERTKQLYAAGAATQSDLETAKDAYDTLNSGAVEASVAQAEAALLSVQEQVGNCSIKAPVSGIVGRIDVRVGDNVTSAKTVAVVSDSQQLVVEVKVGELQISNITLDSKVKVHVDSVSKEPYTGTMTSIASVPDSTSGLFPVTVAVDNPDGKIKSGMYAKIAIDTSGVQNTLCIPLSAVIPDNGVNVVYAVKSDNNEERATRVEVETGINDGTYVQIVSGLKAGDKVVTLGNTLISEGALITTVNKEGE